LQPRFLLAAEHREGRIEPDLVAKSRKARAILRNRAGRKLFGSPQPCLDTKERCKRSAPIAAPWRLADGKPFAVSLRRCSLAIGPTSPLASGENAPAFPAVVAEFMVVPLRDHRHARVDGLHVGIASIQRVARA